MFVENLPTIAAIAIMSLIAVYVVLDGFDIGVGIVLLRETTREDRDAMIESTAATRFSSEWWLIVAAAGMYGAFPFAARALAAALAVPIGIMIAAVALRALAEARRRQADDAGERRWSLMFVIASLTLALAQGFCLGGYIKGVSVAGNRYVGGPFDWAAPFSLLVAVALAIGYALLGAAWLMFRTGGATAERARRWVAPLAIAAALAMAAISVATLRAHPTVSARWGVSLDGVDWAYFLPLAPLPLTAGLGLALSFFAARRPGSPLPFVGALGAFGAGYAGLAASVWPYVVPYGFAAARSAADTRTLELALAWMGGALPCLLIVSVVSFNTWVSRRAARA